MLFLFKYDVDVFKLSLTVFGGLGGHYFVSKTRLRIKVCGKYNFSFSNKNANEHVLLINQESLKVLRYRVN